MEIDLTTSYVGILSLIVFVLAYAVVMAEEFSHLRKSKPVIISAAVIWGIIAFHFSSDKEIAKEIEHALEHNILEFAELFLFLLVAMTYINALEERQVFNVVRYQLTSRGYSFRQLFIFTGIITFFLSPIADNLTTALVMCSVLLACGKGNTKFLSLGCINIVVAANAGGAYSPFGDITTLMVWQAGIVDFFTFFNIFIPSVVNYVIPAAIMYFFIPNDKPSVSTDVVYIKRGGKFIIFLGLLTIFSAVNFHNFLHLPPMLGMMFGLGLLGLYSYYLKITYDSKIDDQKFDFFRKISRAEWDTLLFFFGVILSVGGLGFIGYLTLVSEFLYDGLGATIANSIVGILSAIVDNIPVMFAVITMRPEMSIDQWLLVTLTTGVGGSLLSIGSAAGVALMGQARGYYTFFGHLKWTPVIFIGYIASIYVHMFLTGLTL
ncbi:MAG: Na(+)/H(+) antiporter NhaD [Alphaproteobacteria bacterium MarineAlpha5_Bin8]|nr:MAG: Na(+)/H(+) antiporter NhaD [Alphaproteobacteria bacterium MarineAlpha5_Bin8]PPR45905.1 MAG: Na(+)/H(+) antiporter NhaD [Alphaproteobacteria bacterium MarineAlpha5_Bin7]|tara:strand:+ start:260 stop:1561 length:1302 start_codon:yes stop_codon:yes gene_type:complete